MHASQYFFLAFCYLLVLVEISCIYFGMFDTYFIVAPFNCQTTTNNPNNLFISLYAGACVHEYSSIQSSNIFLPTLPGRCITPSSKNWTIIDEENKSLGVVTNMVKGGQTLLTSYYLSLTAISANVLICCLVFGFKLERYVELFCWIIGFLTSAAFILTTTTFYISSGIDQASSTSWTTFYFKNCEVTISKGPGYTLCLIPVVISGIIMILPYATCAIIWLSSRVKWFTNAANNLPTTAAEVVAEESSLDLWDIFPNSERYSLQVVNIYRHQDAVYRAWTPRRRRQHVAAAAFSFADPLAVPRTDRNNTNPNLNSIPVGNSDTEAALNDDSLFFNIFGEDYKLISDMISSYEKGLRPTNTSIPKPSTDGNESNSKESNPSLLASCSNTAGYIRVNTHDRAEEEALSSFPAVFQSFSDNAFSRSAHFIGLLQSTGSSRNPWALNGGDVDPGPVSMILYDDLFPTEGV